jgi:hypothetical protein
LQKSFPDGHGEDLKTGRSNIITSTSAEPS